MKSAMIPKKLRWWWVMATLCVLLSYFLPACGGSPTESDVVIEDKEKPEKDEGQ
ncbi:hypothetical protein L0337_15470 [candidate division KSB1 bacterium]|nr:hypothetical protein [candidate division KSB1 bacterium]